ncbi:MAG: hypothetical protein JJ911_08950 [Rhizobiaceae bacterium]|nr:hypothetical protein [Rhizobiaceae bacterium]
MKPPPELIDAPLILCEGGDELGFLGELIEKRGLPEFNIIRTRHDSGGIDDFATIIGGADVLVNFEDFVRNSTVVIVADADDKPEANFRKVQKHIEETNKLRTTKPPWPVPDQVGKMATGTPNVIVYLMPDNKNPGALESLIWRHIEATHNDRALCVNDAVECSGANDWLPQKLDKARFRAYVSLFYKPNPNCGLGMIWKQNPPLLDITEATFTPFADFLAGVAGQH